jgi:ketosteroid isomerase-like protein
MIRAMAHATKKTLAALAVLATLSSCGSLSIQEDAAARIDAALQAYAKAEGREMKGVSLQIVGTSALQNGTYRVRTKLADGAFEEKTGTFEAEWDRQPDGSWIVAHLQLDPPPFTPTDVGSVP